MGQKVSTNRTNKFFKDFGIYTIGMLGTRVITFLMVPLYTYFVEKPSDYGIWDLCLQTCIFLLPLSTLQMREVAFRFLIETEDADKRSKIVSFIYKTLFCNLVIISLICWFYSLCFEFQYLRLAFGFLVASSIYEVACQVVRGLQRNDIYASCNVLNAFLVGLFSILFVATLKWGVNGIFWANIVARIAVIIYIELRIKIFSTFFSFKIPTGEFKNDFFKYALPLIPASLCWLFTTVSDRWFIKFLVSDDLVGIYAVAVRFTMVLQTFAVVFYQSWQETAITQYHSEDKNAFFSKVFRFYTYALTVLLIIYAFVIKMCYPVLIGENYQDSVNFLFLSGLGFVIGALSTSFFELGYQCAKETQRMLVGTVLTVLVNVALNLIITPILGVYGVITVNILTYSFLVVYRYFDTKRYFKLSISLSSVFFIPLLILATFLFYMSSGLLQCGGSLATLLLLCILIAPIELREKGKKWILLTLNR